MRFLVDTNVLLRWSLADDPNYAQCVAAVDALTAQGDEVCVCAQVLVEYWAVSTRPRDVNGLELEPSDVEDRLADVDAIFSVLTEPPDIAAKWRELANRYSVCGKQAHDARIAALMLAHGVTHLLTLNPTDFARYGGVTAVTPQEVLKQ